MTTAPRQAHRLAVTAAATTLAREAKAAAGAAQVSSPDWQFYRGVEDAALQVLRPEIAAVRDDPSWLDREEASFREGFLEAQLLLATATAKAVPPMRLPLPQPPVRPPV